MVNRTVHSPHRSQIWFCCFASLFPAVLIASFFLVVSLYKQLKQRDQNDFTRLSEEVWWWSSFEQLFLLVLWRYFMLFAHSPVKCNKRALNVEKKIFFLSIRQITDLCHHTMCRATLYNCQERQRSSVECSWRLGEGKSFLNPAKNDVTESFANCAQHKFSTSLRNILIKTSESFAIATCDDCGVEKVSLDVVFAVIIWN